MRHVLVTVIRIYQRHVSPWTPAACRFSPTCSEYAAQAILRHGRCAVWGGRSCASAAAIRSIRAATTRFDKSKKQ